MNSDYCKVCGQPLNETQWRKEKQYKSCPKCSVDNCTEHIYYEYPESFGTTTKRSTTNNPDGPQSYCIPCRGTGGTTGKKVLCNEL